MQTELPVLLAEEYHFTEKRAWILILKLLGANRRVIPAALEFEQEKAKAGGLLWGRAWRIRVLASCEALHGAPEGGLMDQSFRGSGWRKCP